MTTIYPKVTQKVRDSDRLQEKPLVRYLQSVLPGFMDTDSLTITQFSGGASNLTYLLANGREDIILRRPPVGTKAKSAHDMVREHHILKTLSPYYSLSPKPLHLCEDEAILGEPFFIMEKIEGLGIDKNLPIDMTIEQQRNLCENFVRGLVELHKIDISEPTIAELGKPEGYVKRQLDGWQKRYLKAKTNDVPESDAIYAWLNTHLEFDSSEHSLVHNDYKFDNLVLDKASPASIIGVLDWEMTTLGDPLMDLGCSLAYWVEENDPADLQAIRMMPTHLAGMYTRQEIFDRYCEQREIAGATLKPYYIFGLFRLAVIAQQIYYRFYHGQTDNPKFKNFGQLVGILLATAKREIG